MEDTTQDAEEQERNESRTNTDTTEDANENRIKPKETFNIEKKEFDFTQMRGPELPFNAYTHAPAQLENEEEISLQCVKRDMMKVTK